MNDIIKKATLCLLFEPENYKGIREGVHKLHQIFSDINGVSATGISDNDIDLPSGKAVSTIKAAHCLIELQRTAVFLRGVYLAILQLKEDYPDERIHILYAGCGPYATLLTPLTTIFTADEVAFHMLDINEASLQAARKLYSSLSLDAYVEEWICADATTHRVPEDGITHLIVSETMQRALQNEPQVSIMKNLMPQLPEKGLFVPKNIAVSATLMSPRLETEYRMSIGGKQPDRICLGEVYRIGREHFDDQHPVTVTIAGDVAVFKQLCLLTVITTFGDERLNIYDCSLTMPHNLFDVDKDSAGRQLSFKYRMSEIPGIEYQWID
jgi:hypothetical protein